MSAELPALSSLDELAVERFRADGFLIVENVLGKDRIGALRDRFAELFAGRFDTGIYPGEWYWR